MSDLFQAKRVNKTPKIEGIDATDIDALGVGCDFFCCGLAEIDGIQESADGFTSMVRLALDYAVNGFISGIYLFTSNVVNGQPNLAGDELMDYIHKHKLGSVTYSQRAHNPNSGNGIYAYLWVPDRDNLKDHFHKLIGEMKKFRDSEDKY